MKRKKLREISTPRGSNVQIAAELGCHPNTVTNALKGRWGSEKDEQIRELAMKKYNGHYIKPIKV
jgi:hypothetical protein